VKTLIIGSGIAGITSAIDLAGAGIDVILLEKENFITGRLAQLDRQFPNDACGMCQVYPFTDDEFPQYCLRRVFSHKNIETVTGGEVVSVKGEGPFNVKIKLVPRGVIVEKCISCRKCEEVCPEEGKDSFNPLFGKKKAVYTDYPMPFPNAYAINWDLCTKCGKCVEICPTDAIKLDGKEQIKEVKVDNIIVTTGFEEVNPSRLEEYGYGRFKNVITGLELERIMSEFGPTGGELKRPSDGKQPKKIAFLQCVGSRDKSNPFCSYTCCMYALKEINLLNRFHPGLDITVFYMDMRTFGKGYYRYFKNTKARYIPQRAAAVELDKNNRLVIKYEDEKGKLIDENFDLVVLSVGQKPVVTTLGERDETGYLKVETFNPVRSNKDGIYFAGSATGPKDITDTIIEAHAASLEPIKLSKGKKKTIPSLGEIPEEKVIGLVYCDCGGTINIKKDYLHSRVETDKVINVSDLCINKDKILKWYKEQGLTGVVFAACSPSFLNPIFKDTGMKIEYADVREGNIWGGGNEEKAIFQINAAIRELKNRGYESIQEMPFIKKVVVIGGGIAGMVAALSVAEAGFPVTIVEKTDKLGGNALRIKKMISGEDVGEFLGDLIKKVKKNKKINIMSNSEVKKIEGSIGNFKVLIDDKYEEFGTIVVATGAIPYIPNEYHYGKDKRILTQLELEEILSNGKFNAKNVVMIQCVGSRNEKNPVCSRVCCTDAIKNALWIKDISPETDVYILFRDIMMYGKKELYYTQAREKGIIFLRFKEGEEPDVDIDGEITVKMRDIVLNDTIVINPDYLILSTGMVPDKEYFERIGIETDIDGYVREANIKFKPLELPTPGIYVTGLAHSPRDISESILQSKGVAAQIVSLFKRNKLLSKKRVSFTKERNCAGCGFCVDACPYEARYIDEEMKVARVYPHICQGCGTCISVCPSGAADMREMGYEEIFSIMEIV